MDRDTRRALDRINRRFYQAGAAAFHATRKGAWRGWRRAVEWCAEQGEWPRVPRILDVGCGNGRMVQLLEERFPAGYEYLGVDRSAELLRQACDLPVARGKTRFVRADLVDGSTRRLLGGGRFDLIVLFGVLHHLPGYTTRVELLADLARLMAPGGLLVLTFWEFMQDDRLRQRLVPWAEAERVDAEIRETELEPGDHLMLFGEGRLLRYCHAASRDEQARLIEESGLTAAEEYSADGREGGLNRYLICRSG